MKPGLEIRSSSDFTADWQSRILLFTNLTASPPAPLIMSLALPLEKLTRHCYFVVTKLPLADGINFAVSGFYRFLRAGLEVFKLPFGYCYNSDGIMRACLGGQDLYFSGSINYGLQPPTGLPNLTLSRNAEFAHIPCTTLDLRADALEMVVTEWINNGASIYLGAAVISTHKS